MAEQPTRRDIVMGGAALTMAGGPAQAGPVLGARPGAAILASGTVTEMGPEPYASRRKPIEGVLVSNGRDIVRTDARGCYSLPIAPGQAVFVIKPTGFAVPIDAATKLPRFSYLYDPSGTPAGSRYGGLPPTGPLPTSIDFQLERKPEPSTFDVLLFTDPQPETTIEAAFVRDSVVSGLIGSKAAFGITCGDIAFDDLSMFDRMNWIIGRIGIPWWNIGGNHDLDIDAVDPARARDTFKRVFGASYYAHGYGNALFVMLDNVEYSGAVTKLGKTKATYRGFFPPDQLAFVANLLAVTPRDKLVVLVMHIPLRTHIGDDPAVQTVNAADLLRLIGDRPCVSFAGHTHSTEHHYLGAADGFTGAEPHHHHVLTAVSGSWWSGPRDHRGIASADSYDGTPNGHHVLSIDGSTYTTRFVAAAEPGRQMRISLETQSLQEGRSAARDMPMVELLRSPIGLAQAAGTQVVVNLFDGGPKTRVDIAIDGAPPVAMCRVARKDPFIVQVYGRHRQTIKKWVSPQLSSHLWVATLPAGLRKGAYAVQVTATDEYGRRHVDGMVLEVV